MYRHVGRRAFGRCCLAGWMAWAPALWAASAHTDDDKDKKAGPAPAAATDSADSVYEPGGDVKPPKLVHYVEPDFSPSSKEAFVEGVVRISTVVKVDGKPAQLHVLKGLSSEEDRLATEAVNQWRFQPGTREGQPVNVRVTVEVEFHLL